MKRMARGPERGIFYPQLSQMPRANAAASLRLEQFDFSRAQMEGQCLGRAVADVGVDVGRQAAGHVFEFATDVSRAAGDEVERSISGHEDSCQPRGDVDFQIPGGLLDGDLPSAEIQMEGRSCLLYTSDAADE